MVSPTPYTHAHGRHVQTATCTCPCAVECCMKGIVMESQNRSPKGRAVSVTGQGHLVTATRGRSQDFRDGGRKFWNRKARPLIKSRVRVT